MGSLAAALARRCASKMPPSGYLCEREAYLHGFERHGNRAVLLPFDQTKFLKARHIGMDIRIIALGGFCQRVNAARAFAAQCVEEVQARRSQFGEQRACRLEAQAVVRCMPATGTSNLLRHGAENGTLAAQLEAQAVVRCMPATGTSNLLRHGAENGT